jgi:predicted secreted Zn-dependent protease
MGVWKRRFASWVRTRMDAIGEDNEESKRALQIQQSWPELADTITASVNTAWMTKHPRLLSRHDVHYGDEAVIQRVKEHQDKLAGRRSKAYEQDNQPRYAVGDIVRRMVARSGKLDAAWSL